jgi:hypothetical protein
MKFLLLVFMMLNILLTYSQTVYMKINKSDGTFEYYPIQDIRKITFDGITGIQDQEKMNSALKTFMILKTYPNPFNYSTTIEYTVPEPGIVRIMIFDMNGKLIRILNNENQVSGKHQIIWEGTDNLGKLLPNGIYNCIVNFQNKVLSNKMILIK